MPDLAFSASARPIGLANASEVVAADGRWAIMGVPFSYDCLHTTNNPSAGTLQIRDSFPYLSKELTSQESDTKIWGWNSKRSARYLDMVPFDYGDLVASSRATLPEVVAHIESAVAGVLRAGQKPLLLGGEHSLSLGAIRAAANQDQDIAVVHFDAHLDRSPSASNIGLFNGNFMSHVARIPQVAHILHVGIREVDYIGHDELRLEKTDCISAQDIAASSEPESVFADLPRDLPIYLSIDMDVVDPAFVPKVAWPVACGITPFQLLSLLKYLVTERTVIAADIMELTGSYGGPNRGALLAARIILALLSDGVLS